MSCAACSARIDKAIRKLKGIKEVNVNLLTNSMVVSYDERILSSDKIIATVISSGYGATLIEDNDVASRHNELKDEETPKLVRRLIFSIILLIPLFYLGMGYMLNWPLGELRNYLYVLVIIEMVLSLSIMVINKKFFISGFKAAIHLSSNMDTLVMLGSGVAFIYSFIMGSLLFSKTIQGVDSTSLNTIMMNIFFETAGMVPTLITIGKVLESYSKGKTTNAIKSLMDLSPKKATIIVNEKEIEVDIEKVKIGDFFIVKPGESVPVDGEVIKGNSSVDESMLTGESMSIDKAIGSLVKSATINQDGVLICKAIRVGKDTTINQIISAVEKASNSKAKISKIADRVSSIFVPTVILISLITFAGWMIFGKEFLLSHSDIHSTLLSYSIERGISILVISCPCALGLATPVAIMVGSGKAARNGILFKNAEVIEEAGKIDYLLLDKTGTITKGKPVVTDIISYIDKEELLTIASSLETNSKHPLAEAINSYASINSINIKEVNNFVNVPGKGLSGFIANEEYFAGNPTYLKEKTSIDISNNKEIYSLSSEGKTPLLFFTKEKLLGIIAVSDVNKEDSAEAIKRIKKLGITPIMITGDNSLSANYIANQVGIDYVISDLLPEGKLEVINKIKEEGKVMMVGDGINDSIALTASDVGVAIGKGSDVAVDSASIVLMKSSLMDAYAAIRVSQYTYLNIKENLFWAFIYNLIMIPIAAGVLSTIGVYKLMPWMGSAAMALSSVFVVLNALRINLFNPYKTAMKNKNNKIPQIIKDYNTCQFKEDLEMEKVLKIKGMMCEHCVMHVKKALESVKGVKEVEVSLKEETAIVKSEKEINEKLLAKAVTDAGYEVVD